MRHLMMCVVGEVRRLRMTRGFASFGGTCLGEKVSKCNKGVARDEVVASA